MIGKSRKRDWGMGEYEMIRMAGKRKERDTEILMSLVSSDSVLYPLHFAIWQKVHKIVCLGHDNDYYYSRENSVLLVNRSG